MIAAVAFFGISLGEPVASVTKRLGTPRKLSTPNVYAWPDKHGELLRVLFIDGKAGLVDVSATTADDRREIDLPEHGALQLNASSHVNAQMEEPAQPVFFGIGRMPLVRAQEQLVCYSRSNGTLLAEYFSGSADGGVEEIVFGTRNALTQYGIECGRR